MNQEYNDKNREISKRIHSKIQTPKHLREQILQIADHEEERKTTVFSNRRKLLTVTVAFVVVLACTFITYAAISHVWNRVDESVFDTKLKFDVLLAELGFMGSGDEEAQGVTVNGVTIRPSAVITDGELLYLSFLIEGYEYDFGENSFPKFAYAPEVTVIDTAGNEWPLRVNSFLRTNGFFRELQLDKSGNYGDTLIPMTDEYLKTDDSQPKYRNDDGNLEYCLFFFLDDMTKENDVENFFNIQVKVVFRDLGAQNSSSEEKWANPLFGDEQGFEQVKEGTWILNMQTPDGKEAMKHFQTCEVNKKAEGTDWVIDTVIVSPVSVRMTYHLEETEENKYLKNIGNDLWLDGIRLKEEQQNVYRNNYASIKGAAALDRLGHIKEQYMVLEEIINPENVDGVLVEAYKDLLNNPEQHNSAIYEFQ